MTIISSITTSPRSKTPISNLSQANNRIINNMALVEKSNSGMLNDIAKLDSNINNVANVVNGINFANVVNNSTEKYELRWKGFEGNLIRFKNILNIFNKIRFE